MITPPLSDGACLGCNSGNTLDARVFPVAMHGGSHEAKKEPLPRDPRYALDSHSQEHDVWRAQLAMYCTHAVSIA